MSSSTANPLGYFEFEPVEQLYRNTEWIGQAAGKVVKVVVPLAPALPDRPGYRVILKHAEVIRDPASADHPINLFCGGALREKPMAASVRPGLHRQKLDLIDFKDLFRAIRLRCALAGQAVTRVP